MNNWHTSDWSRERPDWSTTETHPIRLSGETTPTQRKRRAGCLGPLLGIVILVAIYLLFPIRSTILLMGTDDRTPGGALGRTDTMMLVSVMPLRADVSMLSIPRDLWVPIPGYGENRINTAHFFAEAAQRGTGPFLAIQTVEQNFGIEVDYYARFRFDSVVDIVDAMGGVHVTMPESVPGYPAGKYILDGTAALAFVRDRSVADDFGRMSRGQFFINALFWQMLWPETWLRLPAIFFAVTNGIETNVPAWLLPQLGFAVMRTGQDGIRAAVLDRDYVRGHTTSDGANVLLPQWNVILPLVDELFID